MWNVHFKVNICFSVYPFTKKNCMPLHLFNPLFISFASSFERHNTPNFKNSIRAPIQNIQGRLATPFTSK